MTIRVGQQVYALSAGIVPASSFTVEATDPTSYNVNYPLYAVWVNSATNTIWWLASFTSANGVVQANWLNQGANEEYIVDSGTSPVSPTAGGSTTLTGANGIETVGSANTVTFTSTNGQIVTNVTTPSGTSPVLANSSGTIALTAGTGVTITGGANSVAIGLTGGGVAVDSFTPSSGTSPVVPSAGGAIDLPAGNGFAFTGGTNAMTGNMASPFTGDFQFDGSTIVNNGRSIISQTSAASDLYTLLDSPSGSGFSWEYGCKASTANFEIQSNPANAGLPMDGTATVSISQAGLVTVPLGNLAVSRSAAGAVVTISAENSSASNQAKISSSGALNGFFSSGSTTGPNYWNFGNAVTTNTFGIAYATSQSDPSSGTIVLKSTQAGEITKPLQPAFSAFVANTIADVTGNGATYTVIFDTEIFDQNADFNLATSIFTAPVTGRYLLEAHVDVIGTTAATNFDLSIATSNRQYHQIYNRVAAATANTCHLCVLADMDAADVASVAITVSGEAGNTDDIGGNPNSYTGFSGFLAC